MPQPGASDRMSSAAVRRPQSPLIIIAGKDDAIHSCSGALPGLVDGEESILGKRWSDLFRNCQRVSLGAFPDGEHLLFAREPDGKAFQVSVRKCRGLGAAADGTVVLVDECSGGDAAHLEELERAVCLGQMAAEFAHELNNSLTTVLGWLQMLEDDIPPDQASRESLEVLRSEIQRASRKVVSLLSMSRGKRGGNLQPLDLPALLTSVIVLVEPKLRESHIVLKRRFDPVPPVNGVEDELKQVFLNLLLNAIREIEGAGGITVVCDAPDPGHVRARVCDTGCGIPADGLERIFDAYYTTRAQAGGTGLGLFVARQIVRRHNGVLLAESTAGTGSTFSVVLPAGA